MKRETFDLLKGDEVGEALALGIFCQIITKILMTEGMSGAEKFSKILTVQLDWSINTGIWNEFFTHSSCAFQTAAWEQHRMECDEIEGIHPLFRKRISDLSPGAKIIKEAKPPNGLCDFLVKVDGEKRPVEIKAGFFKKDGVIQLRRYMNFYKASIGYAVAKSLKCELPSDMIFIELSR